MHGLKDRLVEIAITKSLNQELDHRSTEQATRPAHAIAAPRS